MTDDVPAAAEARALREALNRRTTMLDSLTEGLILIGADSVFLEWNRAAESILGLTAEQMSGRSPMDGEWVVIRDNGLPLPGADNPIMVALATGEAVAEQTMGVETPAGDLIWLKVNARPVFDENGVVAGAVAAFRDVTASVELQRRSNALAHQLRIAIESGAVGTALIDIDGRVTFANVAFADMVGQSESLIDTEFLDLVEGDRRVMEAFDRPISSRGVVIEDVPLRSDGDETERRWVRLHLSRLPESRGGSSMLVQASDSTALRSTRLELARSEELARVCLDALDQGVAFVSESAGVHRINAALHRILGYTAAELFEAWASPDWEMFDAGLAPLPTSGFVAFRAVELGEPIRDEITWTRHRDGSWRCLSCSAFPFGWTDEVVVVAADLTDGLPPTALRPGSPEVVHAG